MKVIGFIGRSGAGKTTLIERLIEVLTRRGLAVAALKHAHHDFDIDRPGKDSYRFRAAGAAQVMIVGPQRWALMTESHEQSPRLEPLLQQLASCDVVLVEGFHNDGEFPRIEVRAPSFALGASGGKPPDARSAKEGDPKLIALVCDDPDERALPRFARDDVPAIAAFIVRHLGIG
jgi:molybdopterin-guanine dinucleotide biosynthesis protein B